MPVGMTKMHHHQCMYAASLFFTPPEGVMRFKIVTGIFYKVYQVITAKQKEMQIIGTLH